MKCPDIIKEAISAGLLLRAGKKAANKGDLLYRQILRGIQVGKKPSLKEYYKLSDQEYKFLSAWMAKNKKNLIPAIKFL